MILVSARESGHRPKRQSFVHRVERRLLERHRTILVKVSSCLYNTRESLFDNPQDYNGRKVVSGDCPLVSRQER